MITEFNLTRGRWQAWKSLLLLSVGIFLLGPEPAEAHVKWFSEAFSFSDKPLSFFEVLTPAFYMLVALSVIVIIALTLLEEKIIKVKWIGAIDTWFGSRSGHILYLMRIGVGVTLLWCWQAGKLLAPDLTTQSDWGNWLQVAVALLLVFPVMIRWAGLGILILYSLAIYEFGFFHMLDYMLYVGVGWFFMAHQSKNERIHTSALPALYATLGFCLMWLGIEKLVYPSWAKLLLEEHPILALGVDLDFFIAAAALIEISLGFMIMVCLQERLLALTITLVFVLTTMVFGRGELVGHTLIHTVLIVFLFAGPGKATPPLHWIPGLKFRIPATAIAFLVLLGTLMIPYTFGASLLFQGAKSTPADIHDQPLEVGALANVPGLAIALHKDPVQGWNVELVTENFEFAPDLAGLEPVAGKGHAHLHIEGQKVARLYSNWYHIPKLAVGKHEIMVTLNANDHRGLSVDGEPIRASAEIEVLSMSISETGKRNPLEKETWCAPGNQ